MARERGDAVFRENLNAAIKHLSQKRLDKLRLSFPDVGGRRMIIARAAGMPGPSALSEIGQPGKPFHKYRKALASVLGVSLQWLEGTGGRKPDWAMHPIDAWRRYADELRDRANPIDDSATLEEDKQNELDVRSEVLAREYDLDPRSDEPTALAAGRYDEVPFETVMRFAASVGMREPEDEDFLRQGHGEWAALQANVHVKVAEAQDRLLQYVPSKSLFDVVRRILLDAKELTFGDAHADAIADALEMLWRQQWRAMGRLRDKPMPELAKRDTSRRGWSTLHAIRDRWSDESKLAGLHDDLVKALAPEPKDSGINGAPS